MKEQKYIHKKSVSTYLPYLVIITFFLGSIIIKNGNLSLQLPFILLLLVPLLFFHLTTLKFPKVSTSYLALTIAILISCISFKEASLRKVAGLMFILFGWLGLLSGNIAPIIRNNILTLGGYSFIIQVFLAFAHAVQNTNIDFLTLLTSFQLDKFYLLKQEITTLFGESNYLAAFLLFFLGYSVPTRRIFLLTLSLISIFLTLSRTASAIALCFISIEVIIYLTNRIIPRSHIKAFVLIVLSIVFVFAASPLFFDIIQSPILTTEKNTLTLSSRTILWEKAVEMILKNPFWGYGWGAMADMSSQLSSHNGILDYWLSYGLTAMLLFCKYIFDILSSFCKLCKYSRNQEERLVSIGILLGTILMLLHGMIEPLLLDSKFLIFIGLIAGGAKTYNVQD